MSDSDEVFRRAVELSRPPQEDFITLGRCIAQLKQQPGEFTRFLQASGLGRRKAYYLAGLAELFDLLGIPAARLKAIGWTKLQVIGDHIQKQRHSALPFSKAQARDLLKVAETSTTQQLKGRLRNQEPEKKTHCVLMYLNPEQYRLFEEAVLAHGGERSGRGLLHKEEAVISLIQHAQQSKHLDEGPRDSGKRTRRS